MNNGVLRQAQLQANKQDSIDISFIKSAYIRLFTTDTEKMQRNVEKENSIC